MTRGVPWTPDEDATLAANYPAVGPRGCVPLIAGKTYAAITVRACELKVRFDRRAWRASISAAQQVRHAARRATKASGPVARIGQTIHPVADGWLKAEIHDPTRGLRWSL